MFTDLEGFTSRTQRDEAGALRLIQDLEGLTEPFIAAHRGRKVKSIGDGMLIEFPNARDAVQCGVDIQRSISERNRSEPGPSISMRIGIHLGDVEDRGADIFGDAVNIASRIEASAAPGGVCVSEAVYRQVHGKVPFEWDPIGSKTLKGVTDPVEIFQVRMTPAPAAAPTLGGTPGFPRIAVLPLSSISPDPSDEYIADGLTEELITVLSQIRDLRVIARTSVSQYKSAPKPVAQIGSELGVGTVLEGSVRRVAQQIRITVQLIDVPSQAHLWAETYDRKLDDVLAIQSDVARQIASVLQVRLAHGEAARLSRPAPVSGPSYLAYLRGRALLSLGWSEENFRAARERFEEAIALDPLNARAYAGVSDSIVLRRWGMMGPSGPGDARIAREHSARAVQLDPTLAEARCALAMVRVDDYDYPGAEREVKEALSLNPSYVFARRINARILQEQGRAQEAIDEYILAEQVDPQSGLLLFLHANVLAMVRRSDEARIVTEKLGRVAPDSVDYHRALGYCAYAEGDYPTALREWERAGELDTTGEGGGIEVALGLALTGQRDRAHEYLEDLQRHHRVMIRAADIASGYAIMGEYEIAFPILLNAVRSREPMMIQQLVLDPTFEGLRKDPRFGEFLSAMRLA